MKKLISRAVVVAALSLTSTAFAADIAPVYKAPPPAPVVYNWGGFYLGGNVGYAWANVDTFTSLVGGATGYTPASINAINAARGPLSLSDSGFTYGAQAGINVQTGAWVWGAELDLNSIKLGSLASRSITLPAGTVVAVSDNFDTSWYLTGRGRLGYAFNNVLFYGTGGLAAINLQYAHNLIDNTNSAAERGVINRNKVGWTVGGGIEYGMGNWSFKAEYLWLNFGTETVSAAVSNGNQSNSIFTHSADLTAQVVRVGLNYRFGGDYGKAPVVAKY